MEEECGVYAHKVVKPMLGFFDKVNQKIDKNDAEMEIKNQQIQQLEDKLMNLQIENNIYKTKIDSMTDLEELKNKMLTIVQQNLCEKENVQVKEQYEADIQSKEAKILQLETEVKNLIDKAKQDESIKQHKIELLQSSNEQQIQEIAELNERLTLSADKASKCEINALKVIEQNSSIKSCGANGVHKINFSNDSPFEVLCNSDIAGPGWTVIQQRVRGGVDFYRNWTEYRNGFGDFWDGDFFLGLEKIHRLTSEQPHELYIYMQRFDGSSFYARYDQFAISSEDDQYTISKLGIFSGNTRDYFGFARENRFSTFDRDNDLDSDKNCAESYHNGWWNSNCYDR